MAGSDPAVKTNGARAKQNASFPGFINPAMAGSIRVAIDRSGAIATTLPVHTE